ncbi:MAG: hypothetical protein ACFHWX_22685 [Bacteroidota bacterium]
MKFKYLDRFILGFILLVFIAYWPTYFSKFFDGSADFSQYFHFHAITAISWVLLLIIQPILIRRKKLSLHKRVGKISYGLVPILYISVMLLAHHRIDPTAEDMAIQLWIPFKDLVIFSFGYGIAIRYRKIQAIHARGMIVAGMALIEPTMVRFFINVLGIPGSAGYPMGISLDYIILIILMVLERKEKKARWVFPTAFLLFLFIHAVRIFKIPLPFWDDFAHWFLSLPLT